MKAKNRKILCTLVCLVMVVAAFAVVTPSAIAKKAGSNKEPDKSGEPGPGATPFERYGQVETEWLDELGEEYFYYEDTPDLVEITGEFEKPVPVLVEHSGGVLPNFENRVYFLKYIEIEYSASRNKPPAIMDENAIKLILPDWWTYEVIESPGPISHGENGRYVVAVSIPEDLTEPDIYSYWVDLKYESEGGGVHGEHLESIEVWDKGIAPPSYIMFFEEAQNAIYGLLNWDWTLDTDQTHDLMNGLVYTGYEWVTPEEAMDMMLEEFKACNSVLVADIAHHLVFGHGVMYSFFDYAPGLEIVNVHIPGDLVLTDTAYEYVLIQNVEVEGSIIIERLYVNDITILLSTAQNIIIKNCINFGIIAVNENEVEEDLVIMEVWDQWIVTTSNTVGANIFIAVIGAVGAFIQITITNNMVGQAGVMGTGDIIVWVLSNQISQSITTTVNNNYAYNNIIIIEANNRLFNGNLATTVTGNVAFNDLEIFEPFPLGDVPWPGPPINVGNTLRFGSIIKIVTNNRVGNHLLTFVSSSQLTHSGMGGGFIMTTVQWNTVGAFLGVAVDNNPLVVQDIVTDTSNNTCRDLAVSTSGNGWNPYLMSVRTDVLYNDASNDIWIMESVNEINGRLITRIEWNQATRRMDVDISRNVHNRLHIDWFILLSISIIENHIVREDLIITIEYNQLGYSLFTTTTIIIDLNGAGRDINIRIASNVFETTTITISSNKSDGDMIIYVEGGRYALTTITITNNTGLNLPQVTIGSNAQNITVSGNVIFDYQALGGDWDGDGLSSAYEVMIGTNPNLRDTDNDGLYDGWDDWNVNGVWDWNDVNGDGIMDLGEAETFGEVGDPRNNNWGSIGTIFSVTLFGIPQEDPSPIIQDIYVEVDFMRRCPGPGGWPHTLTPAARNLVIASFEKDGIQMHIDDGTWGVGPAGLAAAAPPGGEMLRHRTSLRFVNYVGFTGGQPNPKPIFDMLCLKNGELTGDIDGDGIIEPAHFARNRLGIFHYTVIGHDFNQPGLMPSAGVAEGPNWPAGVFGGDDFFVAEGWFWLNWGWLVPSAQAPSAAAAIASIFMHELGHNLNLIHRAGGNYRSVMNAMYLLSQVDYSDGTNGPGDFNDWGSLNLAYGINNWQNSYW